MSKSEAKEQLVASEQLRPVEALEANESAAVTAGCPCLSMPTAANAQLTERVAWANCQVGDVFAFGTYTQGAQYPYANDEVTPIEWQVLRRDSDGLLVIAKYALDCRLYNEDDCDITWAQCTLRKWLNGEFINHAFDASERQQIKEVHLTNPDSKFDQAVPGGPGTYDKIFLLSHDEAESLFSSSEKRKCKPTDYALANGAWDEDTPGPCYGLCCWWLRSPGKFANCVALVDSDTTIYSGNITCYDVAVRPAFIIAL